MSDILLIVELLFKGPSGWIVLIVGTAISSAITYFTAKHRFRNVRPATHALVGGEGKFRAQDEKDVESLFDDLEACERRLQQLRHEAQSSVGEARRKAVETMIAVTRQMARHCSELSELNIAFRTDAGYREFRDRIHERYDRGRTAYDYAVDIKRRAQMRVAGGR